MTALLLLGPWTPILFQGEEFGATTGFSYFSDVGDDELKEAIRKGRLKFLSQFPSVAAEEMQARFRCRMKSKPLRAASWIGGSENKTPRFGDCIAI